MSIEIDKYMKPHDEDRGFDNNNGWIDPMKKLPKEGDVVFVVGRMDEKRYVIVLAELAETLQTKQPIFNVVSSKIIPDDQSFGAYDDIYDDDDDNTCFYIAFHDAILWRPVYAPPMPRFLNGLPYGMKIKKPEEWNARLSEKP